MRSLWKTLASSVGSKLVIALTGLAMFLFLLGHLAGNLLIFADPTVFNNYAHTLTSNPLLVPIELALLSILLVHIFFTVRMTRANRVARPVAYARKERAGAPSRKSSASSTMIFSGAFLALFIVVHLKGMKFGAEYQTAVGPPMRDLHRLVVETFANPLYAGFYVVAMVILGFHLRHGVISLFQSLGVDHPAFTSRWLLAGKVVAWVVAGGFALIPIVVLLTGKS